MIKLVNDLLDMARIEAGQLEIRHDIFNLSELVVSIRDYGTGIGLSIVKHILDLHQSPIHVKSDVGNGSIFTFTLPLAPNMSIKLENE